MTCGLPSTRAVNCDVYNGPTALTVGLNASVPRNALVLRNAGGRLHTEVIPNCVVKHRVAKPGLRATWVGFEPVGGTDTA